MDYDHFKFQNTSYFSYYFKNAKIGLAFRLIICWLGFPETGKINVSDKGNYFFCIVTNKRVQIRDGFTIWSYFWKAECKEFTKIWNIIFYSRFFFPVKFVGWICSWYLPTQIKKRLNIKFSISRWWSIKIIDYRDYICRLQITI